MQDQFARSASPELFTTKLFSSNIWITNNSDRLRFHLHARCASSDEVLGPNS